MAALLVVLTGCPGNEATENDAGPDAAHDASIDDSGQVDGGVPVDVGAVTDAVVDASGTSDGGTVEPDARADGGPRPDVGIDAGIVCSRPDAQPMLDVGPATDAGMSACPPVIQRRRVDIDPGLLADMDGDGRVQWTCDNLYFLNGLVFVHSDDPADPLVLEIQAGTEIRGRVGQGSDEAGGLVVSRNGRIEADGTATDPIVFTSAANPGQRQRGDWAGVTLIGSSFASPGRTVEGYAINSSRYGRYLLIGPRPAGEDGGAPVQDDSHDCGTLRYVRIEFASQVFGTGNETNGLQMYSCGWETEIDHLQIHRSGDDGLEVFGGYVDLSHVLITGAQDDSFDFDDGWRGRAQFLVGQHYPDIADLGIECGSSGDNPIFRPSPRIFNVTLIGTNSPCPGDQGKIGIRLRGASEGYFRNVLVYGFNLGYIDVGGKNTAANFESGRLTFRNSIFARGATLSEFPGGLNDDTEEETMRDNTVFNEALQFTSPMQQNLVGNPALVSPFSTTMPSFVPLDDTLVGAPNAEAPSEDPADIRPPFFDTSADYVGAFEPNGTDWTLGWTAFPES